MRAKSDCPTHPLIHPRKTVSKKRISVTQVLATHRLPSPSGEFVNIMSVVRWASAKAYDVSTCANGATPKTAAVGGRRSAAVGGGRRRRRSAAAAVTQVLALETRCRTVKQALRGRTDVTKQLQTPMPQHRSTAAPQHRSTAAPRSRSRSRSQNRITPLKSPIPTTYVTYITTLHRRDLRNVVTELRAVQHLSVGVSCPFKPPNKQILSLHRNPPNSFTHHRLTHL